MHELARMHDRRAFLAILGAKVAAWSVMISTMPIHSAMAHEPGPSVKPMERHMKSGSEKPDFSNALAVGRALDLTLPDSRAVRDAYAQAQADSLP